MHHAFPLVKNWDSKSIVETARDSAAWYWNTRMDVRKRGIPSDRSASMEGSDK